MSIRIGDKNKIKNSKIGHGKSAPFHRKNFTSRHPVITGVLTSFVVGLVLLFPFWNSLIEWFLNFFQ